MLQVLSRGLAHTVASSEEVRTFVARASAVIDMVTWDKTEDVVLGYWLVQLLLSGAIAPRLVLGLNAALLPLGGLAGQLFSPAAKLMALTPWVPRLFASRGINRLRSTAAGALICQEKQLMY
jgi:hypothetical protein